MQCNEIMLYIACDDLSGFFSSFRVFAFTPQFIIELKAAKENERCVTLGVLRLATLTFST